MLAQKQNKLRHKHYLFFICQLIISFKSNIHWFSKSHSGELPKVNRSITLGQLYIMFPFWRMTVPKQIPSIESCKHSSTGWDPNHYPNVQQNTSKPKGFSSWNELKSILLNCIINTFTQADTLNITCSITLLLLRSWEGRRFTNWSSGEKTCLVSKERHNSGLVKFHNTYLPPWLQGNGKSLGETLKNAFPIPYGFNALRS